MKTYTAPPAIQIDPNKTYTAVIETAKGKLVIELFADVTETTNNFVFLARDGFYNGVTFHRIIPDFMAQGGDPTGTGRGGPGYKFGDEFPKGANGALKHKHVTGSLSMANAGPDTNGSQFFITVSTPSNLNGVHTIFGRVVEGYNVVEKISKVPVGPGSKPLNKVVINTITIDRVANAAK